MLPLLCCGNTHTRSTTQKALDQPRNAHPKKAWCHIVQHQRRCCQIHLHLLIEGGKEDMRRMDDDPLDGPRIRRVHSPTTGARRVLRFLFIAAMKDNQFERFATRLQRLEATKREAVGR